MRPWLIVAATVSLGVSAGETFPFDSQAIVETALGYLHAHPIWENGLRLNYDEPHVFALVGQSKRKFISVGFDAYGDIGDLGGSFVILEQCPSGKVVVALPGAVSNFANYRKYVTATVSGSVEISRRCVETQ